MPELRPKISIIGCGNVGIRYAYALIQEGLARRLVLVDRNLKRAEGEALDLSHGAPFISPVEIGAGGYKEIAGSDLVVITAGKKQEPGQTRIDLAKSNVEMFKVMIPEIVKHAPDALLLIVSNPVDILSYAAYRVSSKPAGQVIGSGTVLDSARLRFLLARHCGVDPRNVHGYILGEHGDSEFPVWSSAMIGGILFNDYCLACKRRQLCSHEEQHDRIFREVKNSAYRIIENKGETSYGIGLALVRITKAILNNENSILPVSSLVNGFLGFRDLYLSLPVILNREGVRETLNIRLNETEQEAFRKSADFIKGVIKQTGL